MAELFTLSASGFTSGVNAAMASLPGRPQPPIMGAMVIDTDADHRGVTFSTYDWDKSTSAVALAASTAAGQRIAVSGRLLAQVAKVLPKSRECQASTDGGILTLASGRTVFTLPLMDVRDYPTIPATDDVVGEVDGVAFADAVARVARAAAKEDAARSVKGCVSLVSDGSTLTLTALQEFQVNTIELPWEPCEGRSVDVRIAADEIATAIKPMSGASTIELRQSDRVTLFGFSAQDIDATVSVFDGPYPKWQRLFPNHYDTAVDVGPEFIDAIKRAATVAEAKAPLAVIDFTEGGATITVAGSIVDEAPLDEFLGEPRQFGVNPTRMLDALQDVPSSRVRLGFDKVITRPMVLHEYVGGGLSGDPADECGAYRGLLMGIRL